MLKSIWIIGTMFIVVAFGGLMRSDLAKKKKANKWPCHIECH